MEPPMRSEEVGRNQSIALFVTQPSPIHSASVVRYRSLFYRKSPTTNLGSFCI